MFKLVLLLVLALVIEAAGVNYLGKGLKQIGKPRNYSRAEIVRLVARGVTNRWILLGTALETAFFLMLLALLTRHDVSLIWPLTALGFVLTAFSAKFINGEHVSGLRWSGVVLIVVGAILVGCSEKGKESKHKAAAADPSAFRPPLQ
jgi:drug/metabolite transporter (DMT)-like permease